jgi:hypothetical protein
MKNLNLTDGNVMNKTCPKKIELVHCPFHCANCQSFLYEINRLFHESEQYQIDKDYQFAVMSLKKAFEKTYEPVEPGEQQCSGQIRVIISKSLENIHQELKRMTKGFFRRGSYKGSCSMAEETIKEFKMMLTADEQGRMKDSAAPYEDKQINLPAV